MRRYSERQNLSSLSEINITPLLDLAFVLLIIFMITTPLLESSMNLVIPSSGTKNPPINTSQVQTVSIDRTDTIRFNNQMMDLETLTTQLVQLKQANPDIAIVIRPDRDLPVQKLIGVMDALQRAGITKVGIATKADHEWTVMDHEPIAPKAFGAFECGSLTPLFRFNASSGRSCRLAVRMTVGRDRDLAKRLPDRAGARRAYRRTHPLERGSEGAIESREHRVVGWRGRSLGRRIGKTGIAISKAASR